nr:hypothetical protein [Ralstonia solanacearum]
MEAVEVRLQATVSASEFDEHYQMAFVYCMDEQRNYCFSLSRFPDEERIEVMVRDQLVCKVDDVSVTLEGRTMTTHHPARERHQSRSNDRNRRAAVRPRSAGGLSGGHSA